MADEIGDCLLLVPNKKEYFLYNIKVNQDPKTRIKELLRIETTLDEPDSGHHKYCNYPDHACECEAHYELDYMDREAEEIAKRQQVRKKQRKEWWDKKLQALKFW